MSLNPVQDVIVAGALIGASLGTLGGFSTITTEQKINNCAQTVLKNPFAPIEGAVKGMIVGSLFAASLVGTTVVTVAATKLVITAAVVSALATVFIPVVTVGLCLTNPLLFVGLTLILLP